MVLRPGPAGMCLTTKRLLLRDFVPSDVDAAHAFASDPEVTRYTDWGPNDVETTRAFVRASVAQTRERDRGEFNLAAVRRASGAVIGVVAVGVTSQRHHRGELGFVFHRDHWSQGYATEAAGLLLRFGFDHLALRRMEATCHPDNIGSARVLEKIGMRLEGRLRSHKLVGRQWRDSLLYAAVDDDL